MLNRAQIEQYQRQGFLVLEELLPLPAIASIRQAAMRLVDEFDIGKHRSIFSTRDAERGRDRYFLDSAEAVHCFLEEGAVDVDGSLRKPKHLAINKIGHALHDHVPAFSEFCRQHVFADMLQALGYRRARLWQTMYIFKQPEIGGEVSWHQDASYLHCERGGVIGIWVAIEDADRGNGCLWLQPGAQHSALRERYTVDHDTGHGTLMQLNASAWPRREEALAAEVPAGSVVLFDSMTPHYSSQNLSSRSRQAFTMHLTAEDALWSADNWLQRRQLVPFVLGST